MLLGASNGIAPASGGKFTFCIACYRCDIDGEEIPMLHLKGLSLAAAAIGIVTVTSLAGMASASPGAGVAAETFTTSRLLEEIVINHERVKFQTKDPTAVRVQRLTFGAGARTGWHHHPGLVIVAVQSGLVTLTDSDCVTTRTYGPGSPNGAVFVEGDDHAHQASSQGGATVLVTYVVPGDPTNPASFRIEDDVPSCAD